MATAHNNPRDPRRRIEPYLSRLFGYALSLTQDREQARDLVQDCALRAFSAARVPEDASAFRAWLFRILRNAFLDGQKRRAIRAAAADDEVDGQNDEIWRGDDRLISVLTVRLGMAKLSSTHREVIALVDIVGFSYVEAGDFLGVPMGTVMSRLSRARGALLAAISENRVQSLPVAAKRAMK
ncbi:MAG: RNA polymerase sigma factor [Alphaproteobacteria bacterium]